MFDNESIIFIIIGIVVLVLIYCIFSNTKVIEKLTDEDDDENAGIFDNLKSFFSIVLNMGKINSGTAALTCRPDSNGNIICREKGPLANSAGAELIVGHTILLPWPIKDTEYIIKGVVGGDPFSEFDSQFTQASDDGFFDVGKNNVKQMNTGKYCDPFKQKRMFKKFSNNLITKVILKKTYKTFREWFEDSTITKKSYNPRIIKFNSNNKLVEVDKSKKEIPLDSKTKVELEKLYDNKDFVYNGIEEPGYIQHKEFDMNMKKFNTQIFNVNDRKKLDITKLSAYLKTKPEYTNAKTHVSMGYKQILVNLDTKKDLQQTYYEVGVLSKDSEFTLSLTTINELLSQIRRNNRVPSEATMTKELKKIDAGAWNFDAEEKKKKIYEEILGIRKILEHEYLGVISKLYGTIYADYGAAMKPGGAAKITKIVTTEEQTVDYYNGRYNYKGKIPLAYEGKYISRMKRVNKNGKDGSLCYYHHYPKKTKCEIHMDKDKGGYLSESYKNTLKELRAAREEYKSCYWSCIGVWLNIQRLISNKESVEEEANEKGKCPPSTTDLLAPADEWCGPATLKKDKTTRGGYDQTKHATNEERKKNKDNDFATYNRAIYESRSNITGSEKKMSTPEIWEYDEEDRETKEYPGLQFFNKPIYFYVNDLRAYDIKMKNELHNILKMTNKTDAEKNEEKKNIEAYGYSYFPSNYSKRSDLITPTYLPRFPTAQFCYPYIYQVHEEKNKKTAERISTSVENHRKKYLKNQSKAKLLSHGLNYVFNSITYRTVTIGRKKSLVSMREPLLDDDINKIFKIEASDLQIQIDKIFWKDITGVTKEYDEKIKCKLTSKISDGQKFSVNPNCNSISRYKCKPCLIDPITISLVENYKKHTNKIVITKTDYKLLFKDDNFISDLFEANGKLIVNIDDHTNSLYKVLILNGEPFNSDKIKNTKLKFNVKKNYPISMCPNYIFDKSKEITDDRMSQILTDMQKGKNKVISNTKDYSDYSSFYRCYNDVLQGVDMNERKKIMPNINEIKPLVTTLSDYALSKGPPISCNILKNIPGVNQKTVSNEKTLFPSDDLIAAIGTSSYDECNEFIQYNCVYKKKLLGNCFTIKKNKYAHFKKNSPEAAAHIDEKYVKCTVRTKKERAADEGKSITYDNYVINDSTSLAKLREIAKEYKIKDSTNKNILLKSIKFLFFELRKQKILNSNKDNKLKLLLNVTAAKSALDKIKNASPSEKQLQAQITELLKNAGATEADKLIKEKQLEISLKQDKINEYQKIFDYASSQKTVNITNLDSTHVKNIANMKVPYYEERIMFHYDKCLDTIADYLP